MYTVIFAIVTVLIAAAFVIVGLLKGKKFTWSYVALRGAAVILAAPLAVLLSWLLGHGLSGAVFGILRATGLPGQFNQLVQETPAAIDAVQALCVTLLAPVLFYVLFPVLRMILNKVAAILSRTIARVTVEPEACEEGESPKKKNKNKELRVSGSNPLGMVLGAVCGLILCVVMMAPAVGTLRVTGDLVSAVAGNGTLSTVVDATTENPATKTMRVLGGDLLYSGLTTAKVGEQKVTLTKETELLSATCRAVSATKNREIDRATAAQAVRDAGVAFDESTLLPTVAPELLSAAGGHWEKGETFCGIKKPSLGKANRIIDPMLSLMAEADSQTFRTDVDSVVEILALLVEKDMLGQLKGNASGILANKEVTTFILEELMNNDGMRPLVGSIADYGIEVFAQKLQMCQHREDLYGSMITEATGMIAAGAPASEEMVPEEPAPEVTAPENGEPAPAPESAEVESDQKEPAAVKIELTSEQTENPNQWLVEKYTALFDTYGLDVTEESIAVTADAAVLYFAEHSVTEEEMKAFFAQQTLSLKNGTTFVPDSAESVMANTLLVSSDQIHLHVENVKAEEISVEAHALAEVFSQMMSLTAEVKASGFSASNALKKMGTMLDILATTKSIGQEETKVLLTAMFQAGKMRSTVGFSVLEATQITQTMCANSGARGYTPLMESLSTTVEIVQKSSKNEKIDEHMNTLLADLTPESAAVLQAMAKPSVMEKHKVPARSAEASAELFSSMFGNLSNAKEAGMSDEEYQKEAKAATDMTNMAMNMSKSGNKQLFGAEGATGVSANEYVGNILDSKVVSKTIVETVYADGSDTPKIDPLNSQKNLKPEENQELLDALNSHWVNASEEEKASAEYRKNYIAIGAMANLEILITDGGITIPEVNEPIEGAPVEGAPVVNE